MPLILIASLALGAPAGLRAAPTVVVEEIGGRSQAEFVDSWYGDDLMPEVDVGLSEAALESLRMDPYTWVEGTFSYSGVTFDPVGVRLKGENSFLPVDEKPSLKIDFNRYADHKFVGLKGLTFNNMSGDWTMMHERVSYRMYRSFGVPAARCNHAQLSINGGSRGLYASVEDVDDDMISRWFDPSGSMFEIWDVDFTRDYVPDFQLEFGPEVGREWIAQTAVAMEKPAPMAIAAAEDWMDIDQFVSYYAVSALVGQFDSYPYSSPGDDAHVYVDPGTGVLHWLPHGLDETFSSSGQSITTVNGVVAVRCLETPGCYEIFQDRTWEAYDHGLAIDLLGYARWVQGVIDAPMRMDGRKPYSTMDVVTSQAGMLSFIEHREADLTRDLGPR
jgi:spore coat protein CotH